MNFDNIIKYFTNLNNKVIKFFNDNIRNTKAYHKILEIKAYFLFLKHKIKNSSFIILLENYKNDLFFKDLEKVRLFLRRKIISLKTSDLYKELLWTLKMLHSCYIKENTYLKMIKNKFKVLFEKYSILQRRFNIYIENKEVLNKNKYILKQNKGIDYSNLISILGSRQRNSVYSANSSLWPVFLSIFAGIFVLLFVCVLHNQNILFYLNKQVLTAIFGGAVCISFWITTFYKEKQLGFHTYEIRRNIRLGFYIFIFTEAICFLSLFWTFLHALLAASLNIGLHNPGEGIVHFWMSEARLLHPYWERFYYLEDQKALLINLTDHSLYRNKKIYDKSLVIKVHVNLHDKGQLINPYKFPLMNTLILLASACSLNASHTQIKMGNYLSALICLSFTIILGLAFVFIQYKEIRNCTIQFTDGIYGSCFYSLTGLHGTHVILGIFGLFICFLNFLKHNYSQKRHDTYWFAILYWHFVDVVWILVYLIIYVWPAFYFNRDGIRWAQLDFNSYCFNFSEEAFENTFFYKLNRDRVKVNHKLISYAVLKLDENNLFKNNENFFLVDWDKETSYCKKVYENNSYIYKNGIKKDLTFLNINEMLFNTNFTDYNYRYFDSLKQYVDKKDSSVTFIYINEILFNTNSADYNYRYFDSLKQYVDKKDSSLTFLDINEILFNTNSADYNSFYFDNLKQYVDKKDSSLTSFNFDEILFNTNFADYNSFYFDNLKQYADEIEKNKIEGTYKFKLYIAEELIKSNEFLTSSTQEPNLKDETEFNLLCISTWNDKDKKEYIAERNETLINCLYKYFSNTKISEKPISPLFFFENEYNFFSNKLNKIFLENLTAFCDEEIFFIEQEHNNYDDKVITKLKKSKKVFKNFTIFNHLENRSKIIDASNLLYYTFESFNYNGIKKRTAEHAIVWNTIHFIIFEEIHTQEAQDLFNHKYKIFFFFLFSSINKSLCFFWCKYFTPYYFQN